MRTVVKALNDNKNALLESPTGTGKTLSLLCASLAFAKKYNAKVSQQEKKKIQIYYSSRTHSQLKQVRKEIRKTIFRSVKCATLASRDQFCVNKDIRGNNIGQELSKACNKDRGNFDDKKSDDSEEKEKEFEQFLEIEEDEEETKND